MADVRELVARIRATGANVVIDGGKLRLVNANKLPDGALDFLRKYGKEIADWLCAEGDFEERAAIMEFDGGLSRASAEYLTALLHSKPPVTASAADWSWFVAEAARIIDDTVVRRAA